MTFELFLFYVFGAILLGSALALISVRNPVHAALFLVLCFVTAAAIWLMAEAEFLAIVLVLVYVGAVMVLFLFVVMMLDINLARLRAGFTEYLPAGLVVAAAMATVLTLVITRFITMDPPERAGPDYANTLELGRILYTDYVYAFEIAAAILLVAIIAAIALAMRRRPDTKYVDPAGQVRVRRADRVRLVSMRSEPRRSGAEHDESEHGRNNEGA
ncbi:NADH-ubiquinone oxidoreductase chain J [Thioalkalivibrio nitratireducens DSM 14787]|uniref:NADH-quinone oxidoreductase subunit J n=1 Tax=Thioalkalivibrio nitratireducens (strain DSM 14787 / UNIQEM 213 / ALEN2) TaxID=1255043 RepID=L0DYT6_THIND|nr:NADH-quinone oxidoreductase subunit J [Thioalkalivibrio nitratireducens]AGA34754.1 NADH-ubiquinone oxidoreductase chain J [Thioalkalivibrio nitratireducens DSM 14787]